MDFNIDTRKDAQNFLGITYYNPLITSRMAQKIYASEDFVDIQWDTHVTNSGKLTVIFRIIE